MNLFMSVYKRLEKEVISLTDGILFNNKQTAVYSLAAEDIIIRLVDTLAIDKKRLQITHPNMYFSAAESVLFPLQKYSLRLYATLRKCLSKHAKSSVQNSNKS